MAFKKWIVRTPDKELAKQLSADCGIDPFAALIACGRGLTDAAELEQFLAEEPLLCDPHELADIDRAAACINGAIAENQKIAVFGDYDCDGVTATSILYDYLTGRGADVTAHIPDRSGEGYGMTKAAVSRLHETGVQWIITVDNGISCAEEVAFAASLGIRTVVTDHHLPPETLPEAEAVVDPHRADCPSSFKEICGAEVAFKLVCVLDDKEPEQMLGRYADLVAVGTVGDVMPLVNENRSIVRAGIRMIRRAPRTGISALLSAAGIDRAGVDAGRIAFGIVPRINAAGRMGSADRAFRLLTGTDMLEALNIAGEIDTENAARQQTEKQIVQEACAVIEKNGYQNQRVIVVSGEHWHHGVVGIAASRLTEKYGKPTIVLSAEGETAQGSGRSYPGFSLYGAIHACAPLLLKFGGHDQAAGLTLETARIDEFRRVINEYAMQGDYVPPELVIDLRLNPAGMTVEMAEAVRQLEPFGTGNPMPLFGIFDAQLERIVPMSSGRHLRLFFSRGGTTFQTVLFGVTPEQFCFEPGDRLDLAVILEAGQYQGLNTLSVIVRALRMSGTDDGRLFTELQKYQDYLAGAKPDAAALLPTREETGIVYRQIAGGPVGEERLRFLLLNRIGYAKTQIAVTVLCELGLVRRAGGKLSVADGVKAELTGSETYRTLLREEEAL